MRTFDVDILLVPGLDNSGPDHWQSRWERRLPTVKRIEQKDWSRPEKSAWTKEIVAAVEQAERPVVLVAHSLGVAATVHAAPLLPPGRVLGGFLVAPPSEVRTADIPAIDAAFRPYPRDPLPFPSLVVASRDDPWCTIDEAGELALAWGSQLVDAGNSGHLNAESGHGPWPEGALRFGAFLKQLGPPDGSEPGR